MTNPTDFHFYAASHCTWVTTTDERTLPELIKLIEGEGYDYTLWLVPVHHSVSYDIGFYQPQVADSKFLGIFHPKKRRKSRRSV